MESGVKQGQSSLQAITISTENERKPESLKKIKKNVVSLSCIPTDVPWRGYVGALRSNLQFRG